MLLLELQDQVDQAVVEMDLQDLLTLKLALLTLVAVEVELLLVVQVILKQKVKTVDQEL
tara:strand:- start:855 stop:1031 length:177 start_codon:yes stop_codon:yes gene_type:complete